MRGLPAAPMRPLGTAEILDAAVRLVRRNIRAVLTISVPYAVVVSLTIALLEYASIDSQDATTIAAFGGLVLAAGLGAVLTGLLTPLYSSDLLGGRLSAAESVRRVGRRVWPLFGLGLLVIVAEGAGLLACLIGGIWLWGIWAAAAPALVLEQLGVGGALGRSQRLVKGTFWRVWGIRALGGGVLTYVLNQLVLLPFEAVALAVASDSAGNITDPALYVTMFAVGQLISTAFLAPISAAVDVLLYTDLRMRKEGMDIVLSLPPAPTTVVAPASAW